MLACPLVRGMVGAYPRRRQGGTMTNKSIPRGTATGASAAVVCVYVDASRRDPNWTLLPVLVPKSYAALDTPILSGGGN